MQIESWFEFTGSPTS